MNLLNTVALTTYHSTENGDCWPLSSTGVWLVSLSITLAVFVLLISVLLLFTEKMPRKIVKTLRINELKTKLRFDESLKIGATGMDVTMSVLTFVLLVATGFFLAAMSSREDHLVQNIEQKYAIDSIHLTEESHILYSINDDLQATVTKGDKTYSVTVTQNPKTYEPTLLMTPKATTEATELLK